MARALVALAGILCLVSSLVAWAQDPGMAEPPHAAYAPFVVPVPPDNLLSDQAVYLGRDLFFDPLLSANGTVSCATCHNPDLAWSDGLPKSRGIGNQEAARNSPTIVNTAYQGVHFWDGNAVGLEPQVHGPLQNPVEMGRQTITQVANRVNNVPEYRARFQAIYGVGCTVDTLTKAIASFERSLVAWNTPYDQYLAGDVDALTDEEAAGLQVFRSKGCVNCHIEPLLSDGQFHITGVAPDEADIGRQRLTNNPNDRKAYRTPSLRDVDRPGSAPYFHNGDESTIEGCIEFYARGAGFVLVNGQQVRDPLLQIPPMSVEDKRLLALFLKRPLTSLNYPTREFLEQQAYIQQVTAQVAAQQAMELAEQQAAEAPPPPPEKKPPKKAPAKKQPTGNRNT